MGRTKRRDSKTEPSPAATTATESKRRRRKRARPIPKWLKEANELNAIAQRRCLMLLSALSGERPVTDVVEQLQISRQTYYQLEDRAIRAMLGAMMPGAAEQPESAAIPARRIGELETKVQRLEQDKRRLERLLHLTRRVLKPGPVVQAGGPGRPRKQTSSERSGNNDSLASTTMTAKKPSSPMLPTPPPASASTASPSSDGAGG
jgi:hypothetical protein